MSLELKIEALTAAVEKLIEVVSSHNVATPTKPARVKDKAPPQQEEKVLDPPPSPTPAAAAPPAVTYEQVRQAVLAFNIKHGRQETLDKLSRFGVTTGKDLRPEQYAKALADFTEAAT